MTLTIISLVLLTAYIMYAVKVCGIPYSVSDIYYQLEKRNYPKWLFQFAMIVPSMLLLPAWLDCSPEPIQFLTFLSCGGLMFVGAAPCFRLELDGKIHYTATVVCGLSAMLWTCIVGFWYIPLFCFIVAGYMIYRFDKPVFWIEIANFVSTYISILVECL